MIREVIADGCQFLYVQQVNIMPIEKTREQVPEMISFKPFPELETANLQLRRMAEKDLGDLFALRSNPAMSEFIDAEPDSDISETKAYLDRMNQGLDENKWLIWAIEYKQTGKVIGTISIWNLDFEQESGELGYGIMPAYQGRGLMKEALLSVVEYGFDVLHFKALEAYTEEYNANSIQLLKTCRFREVGRVEDKGQIKNRVFPMLIFRLEHSMQ